MSQRRQDIYHHTAEEVQGYIDNARTIVAELELDGALESIAFAKAVDLLAAKSVQITQTAAGLGLPLDALGRVER